MVGGVGGNGVSTMFPMQIHDMVAVLERIGYRTEYGENDYGEPYVFVRRGLPGDIVGTLKLTQKLFERNHTRFPELTRACYSAVGVIYFDYARNADGVEGTRLYIPTTLSECMQESNLKTFGILAAVG